ncbi:MAG: hypothetical protein K0R15_1591 [Clostridiales bacterium]|nr:hypothetical protein [Clostridiales bacterium]
MKKDNRITGLIALAVVTILAFVIIFATKEVTKDGNDGATTTTTENTTPAIEYDLEDIDVAGAEGIQAAAKLSDKAGEFVGYVVTASQAGYGGDIIMDVYFDTDATTITSVVVKEHKETANLGSKIEEPEFLNQFNGITAPVYFEGMELPEESETEDPVEASNPTDSTVLVDGIYKVEADAVDDKGYLYMLTMVVENGAITSVVWDSMNQAGEYKSYLSSVGKYVMVEGNPTWKEQADALAANVIENQSTEGIVLNDQGKSDSVAGVSITVSNFVDLVEKGLVLASNGATTETAGAVTESPAATKVDAVTYATISSKGMINGINNAYNFIKGYASGK